MRASLTKLKELIYSLPFFRAKRDVFQREASPKPPVSEAPDTLLRVQNLNIFFPTSKKRLIHIIRGVDLDVKRGEIVGIVGESGSGKSVSVKALLGINPGAITSADFLKIDNIEFTNFRKDREWQQIRGKKIGYIPQDPSTALNPTRTIGKQLLDAIHKDDKRFVSKKAKREYLINLLEEFGIKDAASKFNSFPDTFSGGMRQRVAIAMVVASNPDLIVADEPTTALDPSVQAAVLALFTNIRNKYNISFIFVSHNISVITKFCDYIYVMYAGKVVERGSKISLFTNPQHPYTWALISAIPDLQQEYLYTIRGTPPDMENLQLGDPFAPRNDFALEIDFKAEPPMFEVDKSEGHFAATWLLDPRAKKVKKTQALEERIQAFREALLPQLSEKFQEKLSIQSRPKTKLNTQRVQAQTKKIGEKN